MEHSTICMAWACGTPSASTHSNQTPDGRFNVLVPCSRGPLSACELCDRKVLSRLRCDVFLLFFLANTSALGFTILLGCIHPSGDQ